MNFAFEIRRESNPRGTKLPSHTVCDLNHSTNRVYTISTERSHLFFFFLFLFLYLYVIKTENSTFATWTENVMLAATGTVVTTILETNKTLINLCTQRWLYKCTACNARNFVFNQWHRLLRECFCVKKDFPIDNKTIMGLVLIISLGFHSWRVYQSIEEDFQNNAIHIVKEPDFLRWIEYTLTSPLQIIIVCSTVYIQNISDITQLSALQGTLTLLGWTLEILISGLEQ